MKKDYRYEAKFLMNLGISVIPVKLDGSKLPKVYWKEYQTRLMSESEIEENFSSCGGVIAITGNISNLLCIDFDLDKQLPTDDFWKGFTEDLPKELKEKMLINRTRSGGFHIWLRTDYEDKSRKIAHRPLTIPELYERYLKSVEDGANEQTASRLHLKKPLECVIETRSRGSYGVFIHEQYERFYGNALHWFSKEEVQVLLDKAYSLDCGFKKVVPFVGDEHEYGVLSKFSEDVTAEGIVSLLEDSGLFSLYDIDSNGNYRLKRIGSSSLFSAYVYQDSAVLHIFGLNPLVEEDKQTLSPFEVYCAVNDYTPSEALKKIEEGYKNREN